MPPKSSRKPSSGWLWLIPLVCLTAFAANRFFLEPAAPELPPLQVRVPIEVVRPGQPNEIIYIEIQDTPPSGASAEVPRPVSRSASIPAR